MYVYAHRPEPSNCGGGPESEKVSQDWYVRVCVYVCVCARACLCVCVCESVAFGMHECVYVCADEADMYEEQEVSDDEYVDEPKRERE